MSHSLGRNTSPSRYPSVATEACAPYANGTRHSDPSATRRGQLRLMAPWRARPPRPKDQEETCYQIIGDQFSINASDQKTWHTHDQSSGAATGSKCKLWGVFLLLASAMGHTAEMPAGRQPMIRAQGPYYQPLAPTGYTYVCQVPQGEQPHQGN